MRFRSHHGYYPAREFNHREEIPAHSPFAKQVIGCGILAAALFTLCPVNDPPASTGSEAACAKWKAAGYPAEHRMYSNATQGFGMNKQGLPAGDWIERFGDWLEIQGFMKSKK